MNGQIKNQIRRQYNFHDLWDELKSKKKDYLELWSFRLVKNTCKNTYKNALKTFKDFDNFIYIWNNF